MSKSLGHTFNDFNTSLCICARYIKYCKADDPADKLYDGLKKLICAVIDDYGYMI